MRGPPIKHGHARDTVSRPRTYNAWLGMRERCRNPKSRAYANYGGRGISVCARWDDYENFLSDMGEPPSKGHSLDRINNNGNYEPSNCRWATKSEQQGNQRRSTIV